MSLSILDRPNSYIGRTVPRPNAKKLVQGRGTYVDDIKLPRMVHVAFVRSPYAHARILAIRSDAAQAAPGVVRIVTGAEMAAVCTPWVGVLGHMKGLKSAPQYALAVDRACWQGEAVVAVVAHSRAEAEDAAQLVEIDWEELFVVADMETALDPETPVIHPELGDNLAFRRELDVGDVEKGFAAADAIVEETYITGRHTGVCLEARSILADYQPADEQLVVYHSTQAPHMMQTIFAKHLDLPETNVRVICKDVGGAFGIKVHTYPDEMATVALAKMLRRPVKFIADRMESFVTDIHARDHRVKARMAVSKEGRILAIEADDRTGIGPYSVYPRTSAIEANQVVNLIGGPYTNQNYRCTANVVFQNKNVMCQYRAVGHPIACAVTEGLVDKAARAIGMDPAEFRRRNLIADDAYPYKAPTGMVYEGLSHHKSLDKLLELMQYDRLRAEQAALREKGIHRGIGLAAFIEVTNPSAMFYGVGGARISAQDGCTIRLDPTGVITVSIGVTEQGQGTEAIMAQIAASSVGVPMDKVRLITGDTEVTPYGGGTWASRGAGIGGEATLQAGRALRENILSVAGTMLQAAPQTLDIRAGIIVDADTGAERMKLEELGRVAYFRPDTLPRDCQPELMVTRHYVQKDYAFVFTNGLQASYLEVDTETGFVTLLDHWVVEDCGTIINPQLVDEQIRGGVVQGLGGALFEECLYSADGQMLNANMADYLVPMASEMPDIAIAHVVTPTQTSELGAKGVGEAGTAGAPAAVMNAINDALSPFGASVAAQPFTPERVLRALGKIR
ncbi:xanthine dehydrogenase family protein molybdopterin-binding subunit [Oceanibaculum pacificum]|uniref:Carbon monoxide dehydrogenase n=1 Tax=Oceanibaculum pacificum TaxID=580166 RepID=A0A154VFG1_9PROT|nr:xanthine dehydrogenase family protein molybdopterin-binding subunit [Oceanibaculum pacificum]KZD00008.1 carbon monoxide dehydrogenase [Oceanibaculum pacificum]